MFYRGKLNVEGGYPGTGRMGINKKGCPFETSSLIKVGDDLLSHNCSTIGAGGLNFSVRNGKRWDPAAIVT